MASPLSTRSSTTTTIPISFNSPFCPKKPQVSSITRKQPKVLKTVSCKATRADDDQMPSPHPSSKNNIGQFSLNHFDRRNVLIGLGGLYGAANLSNDPLSLACPFQNRPETPEFKSCVKATVPGVGKLDCCPPIPPLGTKIIDFQPPTFSEIRIRPAAHLVDKAYKEKFAKGIQMMKDLPPDHPHNFMQQANIHCAYCDDAYRQRGSLKYFDVHSSWFFFPFHRLYLYFFERILGKLIGDPNFGMPFWNWDHPDGMMIPDMYVNRGSSLYDQLRDQNHMPPTLIDLKYEGEDIPSRDQKLVNLITMNGRMITNSTTPRLFFGNSFTNAGQIEKIPHNNVHNWSGRRPDVEKNNYGEDMGIFYSAGRDPVFYAHHSNIDRMWTIWNRLPNHRKSVIDKDEWLDSSFIFYDENEKLVRAKVRDCLNNEKLGYTYQEVDIPWINTPPTRRIFPKKIAKRSVTAASNKFPVDLDNEVSIEIPRLPLTSSKKEKDEEEVLVIENIEYENDKFVAFDVFINDEGDEGIGGSVRGPEFTQYAGSFVDLPHVHKQGRMKTDMWLGISKLLKDLDAEEDDSIVVSLVPKSGKVKIGGVKIIFTRD